MLRDSEGWGIWGVLCICQGAWKGSGEADSRWPGRSWRPGPCSQGAGHAQPPLGLAAGRRPWILARFGGGFCRHPALPWARLLVPSWGDAFQLRPLHLGSWEETRCGALGQPRVQTGFLGVQSASSAAWALIPLADPQFFQKLATFKTGSLHV